MALFSKRSILGQVVDFGACGSFYGRWVDFRVGGSILRQVVDFTEHSLLSNLQGLVPNSLCVDPRFRKTPTTTSNIRHRTV